MATCNGSSNSEKDSVEATYDELKKLFDKLPVERQEKLLEMLKDRNDPAWRTN